MIFQIKLFELKNMYIVNIFDVKNGGGGVVNICNLKNRKGIKIIK